MRQFIRQIHLYLGILVSPYLIIYGLSSSIYNHHGWFNTDAGPGSTTEQTIDMAAARAGAPQYRDPVIPPYVRHPQPTFVEDRALATAVRDQLDLYGNVVAWELHRDSETRFRFNLNRPSRIYQVELDEATGRAKVTAQSKGFWSAILALHGFHRTPNAAFVSTWGIYTELSIWVVLFFIVTGVYLWFARRTDRKPGLFAFAGGLILSAAIIFYAWIGG